MIPTAILESALYVTDLDAAEAFYRDIIGLELVAKVPDRHVFFRCGAGILLLFNAAETLKPPLPTARLPVPPHGTTGEGHLCFAATEGEIDAWKAHLLSHGVMIEAEFAWPSGGRSIYVRDPSGNSIEFANPVIWGPASRALTERDIVVASHNQGKLKEFAGLIAPFGFTARSAAEYGLAEPEETGTTFEQNAYTKAFAAARATGKPALSDDSGLCVDALDGAPGVYTADWATLPDGSRDFAVAMRMVEDELAARGATTPEQRTGRFVAVLCLCWPDGHAEYFRGEAQGTLVWPPRGALSFGYDPVFLPDGHDLTFGEMSAEAKHGWVPGQASALSHRARAFKLFAEAKLGL